MYCLTKIHKKSIDTRFTAASKNCSTKPLSDTISTILKMIFNTVESFHNISFFYSGCKKFWVVQNSFPVVTTLNKINIKKKARKDLVQFVSALGAYKQTTIPHKLLLKVLSENINFVFKSKDRLF